MQTAVQCWERAGLAGVLKPKACGRVHVSGEQAHLRVPEEPPLGGVSRWPLGEGGWILGCSTEDLRRSWRPEGHTTSPGPPSSSEVNVTRGLLAPICSLGPDPTASHVGLYEDTRYLGCCCFNTLPSVL